MIEEAKLIEILKKRLSEKRFLHSCAVAQQAQLLAQRFGVDAERARLAGLLHDICKDDDINIQLQTIKKFSIMLDAVEKVEHKLWHAFTGAMVLQHEIGITDKEIINAVRYHTTARAGMTKFEQILYLSDLTSSDRKHKQADIIRRALDDGLENAMLTALSLSIEKLVKNKRPIQINTINAYNEFLIKNRGHINEADTTIGQK